MGMTSVSQEFQETSFMFITQLSDSKTQPQPNSNKKNCMSSCVNDVTEWGLKNASNNWLGGGGRDHGIGTCNNYKLSLCMCGQ